MIRILIVAVAAMILSAPAFAQTVDRQTLQDIVGMYKETFGQTSTSKGPPPMEDIRPGGFSAKWNEELEQGIKKHVDTRQANGIWKKS